MKNRYLVTKKLNGTSYDLYSSRLTRFKPSGNPTPYTVKGTDLIDFRYTIFKLYGRVDYLDLILRFNSLRSAKELKAGDVISLPLVSDIEAFYRQERV